jgi:endonuclease/exonuclease/phosphatase family metal-dependent hydrolase
MDGKVHLCEVKSSDREIDLSALVRVARRIRPDVVTLAVADKTSQRLSDKLNELRESLGDTGILAELLTLEERDFEEDALLPH